MWTAFLLVICSGTLHAIWNLLTKRSRDKLAFTWLVQWVSILVFLPWIVRDLAAVRWEWPGAGLLLLSMGIHGLYMFLLAKAYTVGDLSQVYPIMRGTSPLLVPLVAVLALGEKLSAPGWLGIGLIVLGIALLGEFRLGGRRSRGPSSNAVMYALAVGACIASYIVVDKLALAYIPIFLLNGATHVGALLALTATVIRSGAAVGEWKRHKRSIIAVGVMAPGGYMLFLLALTLAPIAALAPMREIGTAIGAILGVWLLREARGTSRIWASVLITAGVIAIGLFV